MSRQCLRTKQGQSSASSSGRRRWEGRWPSCPEREAARRTMGTSSLSCMTQRRSTRSSGGSLDSEHPLHFICPGRTCSIKTYLSFAGSTMPIRWTRRRLPQWTSPGESPSASTPSSSPKPTWLARLVRSLHDTSTWQGCFPRATTKPQTRVPKSSPFGSPQALHEVRLAHAILEQRVLLQPSTPLGRMRDWTPGPDPHARDQERRPFHMGGA